MLQYCLVSVFRFNIICVKFGNLSECVTYFGIILSIPVGVGPTIANGGGGGGGCNILLDLNGKWFIFKFERFYCC